MACNYGRIGMVILGALLALTTTITTSATASTFEPHAYGTTSATIDYDARNSIQIVFSVIEHEPSFALPAAVIERKPLTHFPAYRSMPVHQRASGAAVRPSSLAGWRSSHVRRLAA